MSLLSLPLLSLSLLWTQSFCVLVSSEVLNQTAEPGDNVTLTCIVTNKGNIIVVEWSRPDLKPEFIFFYRDGRSYPHEQNPSFKDRVILEEKDISNGDASLTLNNVMTTDSGSYECRVLQEGTNFRKKRDIDPIRTINLKVVQKGPKEEGGHEERGHMALYLGLFLSVALVLIVVGVLIFRNKSSYKPAAKEPSGPGRPGGPEQV